MSQEKKQEPSQQELLAAWVKKMKVIDTKATNDWIAVDDQTMGLESTIDTHTLAQRNQINERLVQKKSEIDFSKPQKAITALERAAKNERNLAEAALLKRDKAAKVEVYKQEMEDKAAVNKQECTDKKTITTSGVVAALNEQLSALLPALEKVGMGRRIGNKDARITLPELKKALSAEGDIGLFIVDENSDGNFALEEVRSYLPKLIVSPNTVAKSKAAKAL